METIQSLTNLDWQCRHTWKNASRNTMWCLLGCSIGDFGTILFFQLTGIPWSTLGNVYSFKTNGV